jgi:hypothetical protein
MQNSMWIVLQKCNRMLKYNIVHDILLILLKAWHENSYFGIRQWDNDSVQSSSVYCF